MMAEDLLWAKISSATSKMHAMEIWPKVFIVCETQLLPGVQISCTDALKSLVN